MTSDNIVFLWNSLKAHGLLELTREYIDSFILEINNECSRTGISEKDADYLRGERRLLERFLSRLESAKDEALNELRDKEISTSQ